MGYESPGQGLARGIVAGTEMGLRVRRESLLEDQVKRRNAIDDEELAWKRDDRTRKLKQDEEDRAHTDNERFLKSVEDEYKQTQAAMQAAAQRYGNNVPPEVAQPLTQQFQDVNQRRHAARQKLYGPVIEKEKRKARDVFTGLSNGSLDISKVPDAEFAMAILAGTEFDPRLFLRGPDGQSQIGRGIKLVEQGLENKDNDATIEGANILYGPSLQVGVGSEGPEGTEIVSKRISRIIPAPGGNGQFIPAMSVKVRDPWGRPLEKDEYVAPPTVGRDRNPNGRVVTLDMKEQMDRMGRLGVVEQLLNTPEGRAKIERGLQALGPKVDTFAQALALSGTPPGKYTTTDTNLGGTVRQTTRNESGGIVAERDLPRTASPDAVERTKAAGIRQASGAGQGVTYRTVRVPSGELDDDGNPIMVDEEWQFPTRAGGPAPRRADLPPGATPPPKGAAAKPPSENEIKGAEDRAKREAARREGVIWDDNARGYVNIKTKRPATPEQIERIEAAAAEAGKTAAAKKPGAKPAPAGKPAVDVAAERARAEAAIKAGKKPELVKALFQERTGQKYD